jgi:hypothetical protein
VHVPTQSVREGLKFCHGLTCVCAFVAAIICSMTCLTDFVRYAPPAPALPACASTLIAAQGEHRGVHGRAAEPGHAGRCGGCAPGAPQPAGQGLRGAGLAPDLAACVGACSARLAPESRSLSDCRLFARLCTATTGGIIRHCSMDAASSQRDLRVHAEAE